MQTRIPAALMRGGTSKGLYFLASDLPADPSLRDRVLLAAMGSADLRQIDGVGGADPLTSKVAIVGPSSKPGIDIDYLFAQVVVGEARVDTAPNCGNMLAGVGPFALEQGLVGPSGDRSTVRIRMVNSDSLCDQTVETPGGTVAYEGDARIDGVPGSAAPIELNFMDVAGSSTGAFLPTGNTIDEIDGIEVTCMDVAMPLVIGRARDFGLTGHETREELDADKDLFGRMEALRLKAGEKMGMGDVGKSVTPKFGLLAPPKQGGTVAARYFDPWKTHPTMAVTGAQCLASCALTPGTVADGLFDKPPGSPVTVVLEHPLGLMDVIVDYSDDDGFSLNSAGILRTSRKIAAGEVFVPSSVWSGR